MSVENPGDTGGKQTTDSAGVGQRTFDEHADEQGYNRHFKRNAYATSSGSSRSPVQSRNVGSRGSRVRQVSKIQRDTLKEKIIQRFITAWEPTTQKPITQKLREGRFVLMIAAYGPFVNSTKP
ncbi:unnamed protein product [Haemonchus placei]|uniref:BHLH domain-containing protein n=1 Tax=Haemonchus placei TaxID=6290 RepID=A0A0N4W3Y5_HAEPC|nr:unnamed protein product [Haemonchus placei]